MVVAADGPVTPPTEASQATLTDLEARLVEGDRHAVDARKLLRRGLIDICECVAMALDSIAGVDDAGRAGVNYAAVWVAVGVRLASAARGKGYGSHQQLVVRGTARIRSSR
ncbi:hypothetical protein RI054_10g53400 [Pseudoscourfieldia marina]